TDRTIERTLDPRAGRERTLRVLIAEDYLVNQEFAAEALRRIGHTVEVAANGEQALALIEGGTFDVVLMDVQMPGMDGIETTRRYRANGGTIPIIALTAHAAREDRDKCLAAGMNAVLTKPLDRKKLAATLRSLTSPDAILDAVGGNLTLLASVSDAFAKQTPPLVAAMQDAIARGDVDSLAQNAHKLKGSVSYFAGDPANALAIEVDAYARSGDLEAAASRMPELEDVLRDLGRRLQAASAEMRKDAK
ncbi:MAG TPA: response regulator, partial [Thermoanaerobaculia bacterium]|nr:response regulator [Thermoanaerobaculia bacterium]